jgi:flagellar hook-length control protein FliK
MRIDENRPSASEEAAADDRKRHKVKTKDKAMESQLASQAGKAQQTKESKSSFDQVLDRLTSPDQQTQSEMMKFDSKLKDVLSDDDRRDSKSDSKKDKDEDKKTRTSSDDRDSTVSSKYGGAAKDKISGKQDTGSRGGSGGGSGSSDDRGGSSKQFGQEQIKKGMVKDSEIAPAYLQGVGRPESVFGKQMEGAGAPREIPKQVLDQIVQHVRIGLNKNLDKEMHIEFSEKFFQGLTLKVSLRNGKVDVSFLTGSSEVRRLFESHKQQIGKALSEKGIAVSQIQVQFLS